MLHCQRISRRLSDWKEWSVIGFMSFIWWRRSSDIHQIWRLCYTTESFGPSVIRQVLRRFIGFHSGVSHRISDKDEGELVDCLTNWKCHLTLDLRPKGVKNMTRAFHCRNWCEIPLTFEKKENCQIIIINMSKIGHLGHQNSCSNSLVWVLRIQARAHDLPLNRESVHMYYQLS